MREHEFSIKFIISCYIMLYYLYKFTNNIVKQHVSFNKKCLCIKNKEDNDTGTTHTRKIHFIGVTHEFQCGFQLIGRSLSDEKSSYFRFS